MPVMTGWRVVVFRTRSAPMETSFESMTEAVVMLDGVWHAAPGRGIYETFSSSGLG